MKIWKNLASMRQDLNFWRLEGFDIALVPTMGNLHAGHLSLVEQVKAVGVKVVVSIFVNPLQFGPQEDFASYPRTQSQDLAALEDLGVEGVWLPSVQTMYPQGQEGLSLVKPRDSLANQLEGSIRPGHFVGVTTVVAKLFHQVQPQMAIFGQKDFQQWVILQAMVQDLDWPIAMRLGSIVREADGLAMSSRNQYLNAQQRHTAPALQRSLSHLAAAVATGQIPLQTLAKQAEVELLAAGFDAVDYIAFRTLDLQEVTTPEAVQVILAVARLGKTRLLDNILLE